MFVVIATARTGSNLLINSLRESSNIKCYGEILNKEFIKLDHAENTFLQLANQLDRNKDFLKKIQQITFS